MFEKIARIERDHEHTFLEALAKLSGAAAKAKASETVTGYRRMFCGAAYEERPDAYSVCRAIGSFEMAAFQKPV